MAYPIHAMPSLKQRMIHLLVIASAIAAGLFATGATAPAKEAKDESAGDDLFTSAAIRHLRIEIAETNLDLLRDYRWQRYSSSDDRPEVPCTVREGDMVWSNVMVHPKGSAGSFRPIDSKPALTLNFAKHERDQRFHGLEKISLNNSVQDPTFFSEKIARETFARAGVPVPRADYATVELNGRQLGLYVLLEGWNKQFLKRHFKNARGNLYDPPLLADLDQILRVANGDSPTDQSELGNVVEAAREKDLARRLARLDDLVDLDRFSRHIALDLLLWNHDGYVLHSNNYRVFHDIDSGRVVFMPHGLDQLFRSPTGPLLTSGDGLVSRAYLEIPEGRQRVLERMREFCGSFFTYAVLSNRVSELSARVSSVGKRDGDEDTSRPGQFWRDSFRRSGRYEETVADWQGRIETRLDSIHSQLAGVSAARFLRAGESLALTNWNSRSLSGEPGFVPASNDAGYGVRLTSRGSGAWFATVWLDQGRYALTGKVRLDALKPFPGYTASGAGFRVWSTRRADSGFRGGGEGRRGGYRRADAGTLARQESPLTGTTNWTEVRLEFELRQPLADLDLCFEVAAESGEAWIDHGSARVTRLPDQRP